jgi:hypothetical protein
MIFLQVCPLSLVRAHCTTISASMETRPQKKRECKRTPAGGQEILIPVFDSFLNPLEGTGRLSRFEARKTEVEVYGESRQRIDPYDRRSWPFRRPQPKAHMSTRLSEPLHCYRSSCRLCPRRSAIRIPLES